MTPEEEYQYCIRVVSERYHDLNLTFQQADKIHKYEQDKNIYSDKHIFSVWEDWDYDLTTFKEVLDVEQFENYEKFIKERIQGYEQELIYRDSQKESEFEYYGDLINFYETRFLPDFFEINFERYGWLLNVRAKVEYLKSEYKCFLSETKKEILINHFRHSRTFQPNELKLSLLRQKLAHIFPNYNYFKHQMDEPTKSVANYVISKYHRLPEKAEQLLTRKFQELKEFNEINFKKHYGDVKGWHIVTGNLTEDQENQERFMTLMLLDKAKYGY